MKYVVIPGRSRERLNLYSKKREQVKLDSCGRSMLLSTAEVLCFVLDSVIE